MNQSFTFTFMIAIIILTDDISIFIKGKFMGISQPCSKHFKVRSVRIRSHQNSLIGIEMIFSFFICKIGSNITYPPINFPIGSFYGTRHPMSTEANVNRKTCIDRFFRFIITILIFVFQPPHVWTNTHKHILVSHQQSTCYIGDFIVEIIQYTSRYLGHTISIKILQFPNFVSFYC